MAGNNKKFSPKFWAFSGTIDAAGFLFSPSLIGAQPTQERILALWQPGASLRRFGDRWLLRLLSSVRVRAEEAPGSPLLLDGGLLCGAPGLSGEALRQGASPGVVALLHGGAIELLSSADGQAEDPASWLDLEPFEVIQARGQETRAVPLKPAVSAASPDVRQVFGATLQIPPLSAKAKELALELNRPEEDPAQAPASVAAPAPTSPGAAAVFLGNLFQILSSILTRVTLSSGSSSLGRAAIQSASQEDASGTSRKLVVRRVSPQGPGFLQRLSMRFNDWAARLLVASKMAPVAGRKQAQYLGDMMEMFERGDFEEALRHAIPLGGSSTGDSALTIGVPSPRDGLSLSVGGSGAGVSILPFAGLYEELKKVYRAAFERLDAQGRVEEAAFVLAELLHDSEEAVAYLERHQRYMLAAELAEGRGLAPGLVVRQWFLAGNWKRALHLVRQNGAFADALVRLQDRPDLNKALRLLWADTMASAGHFLVAELVLAELPETLATRKAWLDLAIAQGGTVALEARLRKLRMEPSSFDGMVKVVEALCQDRSLEGAQERLALANLMLKDLQGRPPELVALAKPLQRALLEDTAPDLPVPEVLARLQAHLGDPLLRTDWPALVGGQKSAATLDVVLPAGSEGTMEILDAVILPGGKALVALGEAGVLLLSREGQRLHHFDQPASTLILSTRGDRALALASRGRFTRVARLDLQKRRSAVWCESELSAWAPEFDGASWLVGAGDTLVEIDALASGWSALWQMREPRCRVVACKTGLDDNTVGITGLLEGARGELHLWRYTPSEAGRADRVLRARQEYPAGEPEDLAALFAPGLLRWTVKGALESLNTAPAQNPEQLFSSTLSGERSLRARGSQVYLASSVAERSVVEVWQISQEKASNKATLRARVTLGAGSTPHASPFGVAVADKRGRIVHLGEAPGGGMQVVRNFRV